jgi:hypothetical protein
LDIYVRRYDAGWETSLRMSHLSEGGRMIIIRYLYCNWCWPNDCNCRLFQWKSHVPLGVASLWSIKDLHVVLFEDVENIHAWSVRSINCKVCFKRTRIPFPIRSEKYCSCDVASLSDENVNVAAPQDSILKTTATPGEHQLQFSRIGKVGRFCRRGCCDFTEKYAAHTCQKWIFYQNVTHIALLI